MSLEKINKVLIVAITVCFRLVALFYSSTILNYTMLGLLVGLCIINLFYKEFNNKQTILMAVFLLLSSLMFVVYNEDNLFIYFICALAFLDEKNNRKLVTLFTIITIISFIGVVLSGELGIINIKMSGRVGIYRSSLGFGNVNTPFVYFTAIMFGLYYLFGDNKKLLFLIYILTTFVAIYIFGATNSRTGYYIYYLFIISSLLYNKKINKYFSKIVPSTFFIFLIVSILIAVLYGQNISNEVNVFLSNRPYFSYYYIQNYLWFNLLGNNIVSYYVLDNFYLATLVKIGFIGFITYAYIFVKGSLLYKKDEKINLIIFFILLYGVLESNFYGNFIYVLLLKEIIKGSDNNEKRLN